MEYEVATLLVTDIQQHLSSKSSEGWQVHTMTLVGAAEGVGPDNSKQEVPLFTILLHRMVPVPEEKQEDDKPRAMAMKG